MNVQPPSTQNTGHPWGLECDEKTCNGFRSCNSRRKTYKLPAPHSTSNPNPDPKFWFHPLTHLFHFQNWYIGGSDPPTSFKAFTAGFPTVLGVFGNFPDLPPVRTMQFFGGKVFRISHHIHGVWLLVQSKLMLNHVQ